VSLSFHEFMHAYVANRIGDPTAKLMGRMTLNPLAHIDPIGLIAIIFTGFGWAKPVPVNPVYFKDSNKGMFAVSLAGPVSNIILALIFGLLLKITEILSYSVIAENLVIIFYEMFLYGVLINLALCVFNIIPLAPLDGSKVLLSLIDNYNVKMKLTNFYNQYSSIVLLFLLISGVIDKMIDPIISFLFNLIVNVI